jgi:hypothetical protein
MKAIENKAAEYVDRGYAVKMDTEAVYPPGSQGHIPETVWHRVTVVDPQSGRVVADFGGMTRADTPYNNGELLFRGEQNFPDQTVGRIIN